MSDIKLIKKDTDLSKLPKPLNWDVVINGTPYYVVKIDGYVHTIGGKFGNNCFWAYPRNEKPSYENLIEFGCDEPVCWGITFDPYIYTKSKWDECEARRAGNVFITRNGKKFHQVMGGIDRAKVLLEDIKDHPAELDLIDYDKKLIGRKVWWRSEPAIITYYCEGQASVILEPDGIDKFTTPAEFANEEDDEYYEDGEVKTTIFDKHIWWFRD